MKVIALAVMAAACCALKAADSPILTGKIAPDGRGGISIAGPDFVISAGARSCLVAPGWKKVYFRNLPHPGRPAVKVAALPDGYNQTMAPSPATEGAALEEYSVRCQGNRAVVSIRVRGPEKSAAELENVALTLRAGILSGAEYELTAPDGKVVKGVIPETPVPGKRGLLPQFTKCRFRGELGTVTVEVLSGPPVIMDDRRTDIFSGFGPGFIVWSSEIPVPAGGTAAQSIALTWDFPASGSSAAANVAGMAGAPVLRQPEPEPEFPLLPEPKSLRYLPGEYRPAAGDTLCVKGGSPRFARHAAALAAAWGLTSAAAPGSRGVAVNISGRDPECEAYTLKITPAGVSIEAAGERGAFYALQTLRGLRRNGVCRCAEISDAPAFRDRIVHVMADSDTLEHLTPLITNVLAPLKINTILIECPYVKWDALAGMEHPKGMDKADLVKILNLARENYIRVWPLIPTFSHSEWFFQNDVNIAMIDYVKDRTAYNPLHPGVYPLLEKLFTEVLATFGNPEYFHISHDELAREYPRNPAARKAGIKKLLKDDILWHYNFFKARGVKVMLWHDMLVSRAENGGRPVANAAGGTEQLRSELPKDLDMVVWNYGPPAKGTYPEAEIMAASGFPIHCAGWYPAGNLEALSAACKRLGGLGMIITTWHWKFNSAGIIYTQYGQVHSYVRAAALFWNPSRKASYDYPRILVDLMRKPERRLGTLTPIAVNGNLLPAAAKPDFAGISGNKVTTPEGITFQLLRDGNGNLAAAAVKSRRCPELPAKIRIPLGRKCCDRLHLLQTLLNGCMRQDGKAVKLVIRYTDGTYEPVYLRNGVDVAYGNVPLFHTDGRVSLRPEEVGVPGDITTYQRNHRNRITWNANGKTLSLWSWTWENPHPERPVDHLLIEAVDLSTTYALLALTMENLSGK